MQPFLTLYTPTFKRPKALARCLKSVETQSAIDAIEHIVIVDHIGRGVGGMYLEVPKYADAVHGEYVHILADDDVLVGPDVVARARDLVVEHDYPAVLVVSVIKDTMMLPLDRQGPPIVGRIDLGCLLIRADVWKAHVHAYGDLYEGDFHMADALWQAGHRFVYAPELMFLVGDVRRGEPEAA